MSDHFVYILECSDQTYYVGSTTDLLFRLEYHHAGKGGAYTARRLPVKVVFQETHPTAESARQREKQIKRWSHAKKAALVTGDAATLKRASRSKQRRKRQSPGNR